MSYEYIFKVVLLGDCAEGKDSFTKRDFCQGFDYPTKLTIGLEFHTKTMEIAEKQIQIQIWDIESENHFRFQIPLYCHGANGAILVYDVTRSDSLRNIDDNINIIRERAGSIPIILIGSNLPPKGKTREISREKGIEIAQKYKLSAFAETSSQNIRVIEKMFQTLVGMVLRKYLPEYPATKLTENLFIVPESKEFIVNDYLKLRLEKNITNIYVSERLFLQCKYLMLNISLNKIRNLDSIESIDEAAERLDASMEGEGVFKFKITPETEYWAHCSNIQLWYENNYATHLLHRNLAFPLLEALTKGGDPLAKKVFNEEIARRFESGYPSVVLYLINEGYLDYLNDMELERVVNNPQFVSSLPSWFFKSDISKRLYQKLLEPLRELDCPHCSTKFRESLSRTVSKNHEIKCKFCFTSIAHIK